MRVYSPRHNTNHHLLSKVGKRQIQNHFYKVGLNPGKTMNTIIKKKIHRNKEWKKIQNLYSWHRNT